MNAIPSSAGPSSTRASAAPDRGYRGLLPRLPRLEDESYADFVEGLRVLCGAGMSQPAMMALHGALGTPPAPVPQMDRVALRQAGDPIPVLATRNRLLRSSQQMMWRSLNESWGRRRAEIEAALTAAETQGPGTLEYSPDFPVPEYTKREFHIQPGGYQGDALTGHVYHYGTKVFFTGSNDQDDMHRELATAAPRPADGRVQRVLDIGCSIGQGTTALKQALPQAEVTGIDIGAPMLRYAHWRAVQLGSDVHFKQRLIEASGFPDAHFDMVQSVIVFHEVPWAITQQAFREMFRVLRPGGTFNVFDFPAGDPIPAGLQYFLDIDASYNGEPYSTQFIYADVAGELARAGFAVTRGPNVARYLRTWFCTKPA
jgi:ubiquinone/menaquinone biosynthesis C-methylase UbiE